ncbi:hypothetical protein SXCC_03462 [Gluconacetobacter sp. SXCC-1]|nr:hypothetical protein SXCC_03462 [Gluconacetobacter sp. SXCC-1]
MSIFLFRVHLCNEHNNRTDHRITSLNPCLHSLRGSTMETRAHAGNVQDATNRS